MEEKSPGEGMQMTNGYYERVIYERVRDKLQLKANMHSAERELVEMSNRCSIGSIILRAEEPSTWLGIIPRMRPEDKRCPIRVRAERFATEQDQRLASNAAGARRFQEVISESLATPATTAGEPG